MSRYIKEKDSSVINSSFSLVSHYILRIVFFFISYIAFAFFVYIHNKPIWKKSDVVKLLYNRSRESPWENPLKSICFPKSCWTWPRRDADEVIWFPGMWNSLRDCDLRLKEKSISCLFFVSNLPHKSSSLFLLSNYPWFPSSTYETPSVTPSILFLGSLDQGFRNDSSFVSF